VLKRVKLGALIAVVAAAALLPLYGDPRNAPVTHAEWARMLLRGLKMEEAARQATTASQAFAILSWKGSLSLRADRYVAGDDIRVEGDGDRRHVVATGEVGEVDYALAVARGGDYRMRVEIAGTPDRPASTELARVGEVKPVGAFTVVPAAQMAWVDAGRVHLDPGAYTASVLLPRGTALEHVEVAPPCLSPIEPPGGWKAAAVLLSEDAAVTIVQALDRESELPPAASPIETDGSGFQTDGGSLTPASLSAGRLDALWVRAGPSGTRAVVSLDLPEAGLYTISAFGVTGGGQSWTADACLKSVVCAEKDAEAAVTKWRPVITARFAAGPHSFSVLLAPGAVIQRMRAEKKKDSPSDYASALRRLGFDVGAPGPMARDRAVDAMRFLESRASALREALCGDLLLPTAPATRAGLEVAQIPGPGQAPLNAGLGQPPLGTGPTVPLPKPSPSPSPAASPSAGPTPTPTPPASPTPPPPSPTPPPPKASPTPPPPPPTLASPPVPSPVRPVFASPAS